MVTYNHRRYIAQAIEGVLSQDTNFPIELVIGEDQSTDGTREVVFDYQRRHPDVVHVVTSDKNIGALANWRRTLEACRGRYTAFCEGDDLWHTPRKLQVQVQHIESHDRCGMVYSDYDLRDAASGIVSQRVLSARPTSMPASVGITDILTATAGIMSCTVLARRALIKQVLNADLDLHLSGKFLMGDTQLWAEIALLAEVHFINQSLATYNRLEESASQSQDLARTLRFWKSNSEMAMYLCKKHGLSAELLRGHEGDWRKTSLQLAGIERRPDHAEQVRRASSEFTLEDWMWYQGVKHPKLGNLLWRYHKARARRDAQDRRSP